MTVTFGSMDRSDGLYLTVAVLQGGRRVPIEIEARGPLAAQDRAEIALGRQHLRVVELLGSIERIPPSLSLPACC